MNVREWSVEFQTFMTSPGCVAGLFFPCLSSSTRLLLLSLLLPHQFGGCSSYGPVSRAVELEVMGAPCSPPLWASVIWTLRLRKEIDLLPSSGVSKRRERDREKEIGPCPHPTPPHPHLQLLSCRKRDGSSVQSTSGQCYNRWGF